MATDNIIITIDGPAGAGKTTVSKLLADRLNYAYVDTGALYRGVAFVAYQKAVEAEDDTALASLCAELKLEFQVSASGTRLVVNEVDITDHIRTPEISMLASDISARPVVREFLLDVQRELGRRKAAVFEGRDMGTVVFPEAEVKFFLDASARKRAERRYKELAHLKTQTLEEVQQAMVRRDTNDSTRHVAPLKPAPDAVYIDSSDLTIEGVVERMLAYIKKLN
jgi:cytidylate kinase